ncbi:Uncharacterised protein [Leclercia adecarboxylata]|nr:Uncharacterised protein [Leclercia adecarboxylata]
MEQEVLQIAQHVTRFPVYHHLLLTFCEVVHDRFVRVQFGTVLVEISHFQLGPAMDAAAVGLQLFQHQLQQGRLATAVRADESNFIPALNLGGKVLHQHFAVYLVVDVFHLKDDFA